MVVVKVKHQRNHPPNPITSNSQGISSQKTQKPQPTHLVFYSPKTKIPQKPIQEPLKKPKKIFKNTHKTPSKIPTKPLPKYPQNPFKNTHKTPLKIPTKLFQKYPINPLQNPPNPLPPPTKLVVDDGVSVACFGELVGRTDNQHGQDMQTGMQADKGGTHPRQH